MSDNGQGPGNIGPVVRPDIRSLLDTERTSLAVSINKVQVGLIDSWDPDKQRANIRLVNKRAVYNTPMPTSAIPPAPTLYDYPLLLDVPVFVLSGGTAYIAMPIAPGDPCIVLFNDRDLDPWATNGTTGAVPNTSRVHSLSDGIAIVGIRPATNAIPGLPSDGIHIGFGNDSGTLISALDSLSGALASLCTALESAVISGSAFNAATITAITAAGTANTAAKTALDAILQ